MTQIHRLFWELTVQYICYSALYLVL